MIELWTVAIVWVREWIIEILAVVVAAATAGVVIVFVAAAVVPFVVVGSRIIIIGQYGWIGCCGCGLCSRGGGRVCGGGGGGRRRRLFLKCLIDGFES